MIGPAHLNCDLAYPSLSLNSITMEVRSQPRLTDAVVTVANVFTFVSATLVQLID